MEIRLQRYSFAEDAMLTRLIASSSRTCPARPTEPHVACIPMLSNPASNSQQVCYLLTCTQHQTIEQQLLATNMCVEPTIKCLVFPLTSGICGRRVEGLCWKRRKWEVIVRGVRCLCAVLGCEADAGRRHFFLVNLN